MRVLVVERHGELAETVAAALCRERRAAHPAPYGPTAPQSAERDGREVVVPEPESAATVRGRRPGHGPRPGGLSAGTAPYGATARHALIDRVSVRRASARRSVHCPGGPGNGMLPACQ
nr:hypothetical protein [Streptomyces sp. RPA4-2]QIY64878.1 hypothetical protein HEP85_28755 [Streptomyces sp. RPA4-2]